VAWVLPICAVACRRWRIEAFDAGRADLSDEALARGHGVQLSDVLPRKRVGELIVHRSPGAGRGQCDRHCALCAAAVASVHHH
jgi:hypothetical protein